MGVALDASVIRAINKFARTPMGRKYDRFARKRYGIQGKLLMAKTVAGENGGRGTKKSRKLGIRSSAGAFGPAQFIPSTREAYMQQYNVDPWRDDYSAMKGMAIHHMGTGVEGYNPGMPTYKDYIMGQRIDKGSWRALKNGSNNASFSKGRSSRRGPGKLVTTETTTPGVDLSAERDALKLQTLTTALSQGRMASQSELLSLGAGLRQLKDTPGETTVGLEFKPGKRGKRRGGGSAAGRIGTPRPDGWRGSRAVGAPIARIAFKQGLKSVSEKRDTVNTASGGVSDHYSGNKDAYAWDLSNGSAPTKEMDRSAMRIAKSIGAGKTWKQMGRQGVLNVTKKINGRTYRFQMLYRTNVGGNHYNHVHFGVRRVS